MIVFRGNLELTDYSIVTVSGTKYNSSILTSLRQSTILDAEVVKIASERDFERGHKMLRKMAAFGDSDEIERAKKRLAMEEQAQLTVARSITKSATYFVSFVNDFS